MSVAQVEQAIQQGLWRLDQSFVFGADRDFLSTLTLGKIIAGRVMRHYEGGRYGVAFGGEERVVDSSIPLRTGELIHGRVIGLDDKVHLQRVVASPRAQDGKSEITPESLVGGRDADGIEELFLRHRSTINAEEQASVRALGRSAGDLALAASSALVLRKLGLPLDRSLIQAVVRALSDRGQLARPLAGEQATALIIEGRQPVGTNADTVQRLARMLADRRLPERPSDHAARTDRETGAEPGGAGNGLDMTAREAGADAGPRRDHQEWLLGRWLLNAQGGGAVAHRYFTLPLWLGDRLIELNLAFFAQTGEPPKDGVRYRRIVLSLDLEDVGRVEIVVRIANERLRIAFEASSELATDLLGARLGDLKAVLAEHGWQVDELRYATRLPSSLDLPAQSVVSHHVRQDSLSRLL